MRAVNDPKKGARRTNTDEQEVAVNHSTEQEGGYDKPVNQETENSNIAQAEEEAKKHSDARKVSPGPAQKEERKRKYPDEESE